MAIIMILLNMLIISYFLGLLDVPFNLATEIVNFDNVDLCKQYQERQSVLASQHLP